MPSSKMSMQASEIKRRIDNGEVITFTIKSRQNKYGYPVYSLVADGVKVAETSDVSVEIDRALMLQFINNGCAAELSMIHTYVQSKSLPEPAWLQYKVVKGNKKYHLNIRGMQATDVPVVLAFLSLARTNIGMNVYTLRKI